MEDLDLGGDFPRADPLLKAALRTGTPTGGANAKSKSKSRDLPSSGASQRRGASDLSFPFVQKAEREVAEAAQAAVGESLEEAALSAASSLLRAPLKQGSLLVAVVGEVHGQELLMHLPHGALGVVSREHTVEASALKASGEAPREKAAPSSAFEQEMLQRFRVGQLLPCVILAEPSARGVYELSLRPSICNAGLEASHLRAGMLLPASVSSVEEHGFQLALGMRPSIRAFLPSLNSKSKGKPSSPILKDAVLSVVVSEVNAAAASAIFALPREEAANCPPDEALPLGTPLDWTAVRPGLLVEARVDGVLTEERSEAAAKKRRTRDGSAEPRRAQGNQSSAPAAPEGSSGEGIWGVRLNCLSGIRALALTPHVVHPALLARQREQQRRLEEFSRDKKNKRKGSRRDRADAEDDPSEAIDSPETAELTQRFAQWTQELCALHRKVYVRVVAVLPQIRTAFVSILPHVVGWSSRSATLLPTPLLLPGAKVKAPLPVLDSYARRGRRALLNLEKFQQRLQAQHGGEETCDQDKDSLASSSAAKEALSGQLFCRWAVLRFPHGLDDSAEVSSRKRKEQMDASVISRCRVLYVHRMDLEAIATTSSSLFDEKFITPFDAAPGEVVVGTVVKVVSPKQVQSKRPGNNFVQRVEAEEGGVVIRLSSCLTGWAPLSLLSDTPIQQIPQNMALGSTVCVRVLRRFCCASCDFLETAPTCSRFFFPENPRVSDAGGRREHLAEEVVAAEAVRRGMLASALMGSGGGGGGKLLLTAKRALLKLQQPLVPPPLSSLPAQKGVPLLKAGSVLLGYVSEVRRAFADVERGVEEGREPSNKKQAVTLRFFGGFKAVLAKGDVERSESQGKELKLGVLVRVCLTAVNATRGAFTVSTDLGAAAAVSVAEDFKNQLPQNCATKVLPGSVVSGPLCYVVSVHANGVVLLLLGARHPKARETPLQRASDTAGVVAFAPTLHLADEVQVAEALAKSLEVGKAVPFDGVVLAAAAGLRPGEVLRTAGSAEDRRHKKNSSASSRREDAIDRLLARTAADVISEVERREGELRDACIVSFKPSLLCSSRPEQEQRRSRRASSEGRQERAPTFFRNAQDLERGHAAAGADTLLLWAYVKHAENFGLLVALGATHAQAASPFRHVTQEFVPDKNHLAARFPVGLTLKAALLPQQRQQQHLAELRPQKINKLLRETPKMRFAEVTLGVLKGIIEQRTSLEGILTNQAASALKDSETCVCSAARRSGALLRCVVESEDDEGVILRVEGCKCLTERDGGAWKGIRVFVCKANLPHWPAELGRVLDCLVLASDGVGRLSHGCCTESVLGPLQLLRESVKRHRKEDGCTAIRFAAEDGSVDCVVSLKRREEGLGGVHPKWDPRVSALPLEFLRKAATRLAASSESLKGVLGAELGLLGVAVATSEVTHVRVSFLRNTQNEEPVGSITVRLPMLLTTICPVSNNERKSDSPTGFKVSSLVGCALDLHGPFACVDTSLESLPPVLMAVCCRSRDAKDVKEKHGSAGFDYQREFERQQEVLEGQEISPKTVRDLKPGAVVRCRLTKVTPYAAVGKLVGSKFQAAIRLHPADALPPVCKDSQSCTADEESNAAWLPPPLTKRQLLPSPLRGLRPQQQLFVVVLSVQRHSTGAESVEEASADAWDDTSDDEALHLVAPKHRGEALFVNAGFYAPIEAELSKKKKRLSAEWAVVEKTLPGHLFVSCGWSSAAGAKESQEEQKGTPVLRKGFYPRRRGCVSMMDASRDRTTLAEFTTAFPEGEMVLVRELPPLHCTEASLRAAAADASSSAGSGDSRRFIVVGGLDSSTDARVVNGKVALPLLLAPVAGADVPSAISELTQLLLRESGEAETCLTLRVPLLAAVHLTELTDEWISDPVKRLHLKVGQLVKVRVLPPAAQPQGGSPQQWQAPPLQGTMRLSAFQDKSTGLKVCGRPERLDDVKEGQVLPGLVVSSNTAGVFVSVSRSLTVRIRLQNIAEGTEFQDGASGILSLEEIKERFPPGSCISNVTIAKIDASTGRIEGSLRAGGRTVNTPSTAAGETKRGVALLLQKQFTGKGPLAAEIEALRRRLLCCLKTGDLAEGEVSNVTPFGVFVRLHLYTSDCGDGPVLRCLLQEQNDSGKTLDGIRAVLQGLRLITADALCPLSGLGADSSEERERRLAFLKQGDWVQARILSVNPTKAPSDDTNGNASFPSVRIEISLDPADLPSPSSDDEGNQNDEVIQVANDVHEQTPIRLNENKESLSEKVPETMPATEVSNSELSELHTDVSMTVGDPQQTSRVWDWEEVKSDAAESEASEDECHSTTASKKKKRQKLKERKEHAIAVEELEKSQAEHRWQKEPQEPNDFERLILIHGNAAAVWISYMAMHLKVGELDKARAVAERAVKHASFTNEQERFAVWMAYMNMECCFGDSVMPLLKRALQYLDAKQVYYQTTFVFEKAGKVSEALIISSEACKKYPESQKIWVRELTLQFTLAKDPEAARASMLKALHRLPRRKHIQFVCTCARLEYHHGSADRGQTYYEKLIAEHPKRTDIWSLYLDQHISFCTPPRSNPPNIQPVRLIFERAVSLPLKPHKMKALYAKWLAFERKHGDAESQSHVQKSAREYVLKMEHQVLLEQK